jgi:type IV secretion system protein VirD4
MALQHYQKTFLTMNIIESIFQLFLQALETLFSFLFEFIEMAITGIPKRKKGYNSSFISARNILSTYEHGFCLTGKRNLSIKNSYQNALIIGGTGVGKSSVVLIPSLYTMNSSFIVHDPSGELFTKTGGYLKAKGFEVKVLNFANPSISSGYNPLARAQGSSDIQKISSMLVMNAFGEKSKDPFWNTQASALIAIMISALKNREPEFQNLFNVRHLLNLLGSDPKEVDSIFSKSADEVLFSEYKAFIAYDEKVVSGVISTAKAALQIFSDESVAKVTFVDNINLQEFRTKQTALFIQNSVADQKYYSILTSLFFEQFFSFVLGRFPSENEKDIFLLIDEASSLNLPTLPLAVANVRKHRAGVMLLVQDFSQIIHHYGKYDADAIKSNCFAKMYFTGQSLETTKELETTLGRFEYEDEYGKKVTRPLMTNDEIRTMQSKRALLVCGNYSPIIAHLKPFYKNSEYKKYSLYPVPNVTSSISFNTLPPLINNDPVSNK